MEVEGKGRYRSGRRRGEGEGRYRSGRRRGEGGRTGIDLGEREGKGGGLV